MFQVQPYVLKGNKVVMLTADYEWQWNPLQLFNKTTTLNQKLNTEKQYEIHEIFLASTFDKALCSYHLACHKSPMPTLNFLYSRVVKPQKIISLHKKHLSSRGYKNPDWIKWAILSSMYGGPSWMLQNPSSCLKLHICYRYHDQHS